jgi:hypothetical protein
MAAVAGCMMVGVVMRPSLFLPTTTNICVRSNEGSHVDPVERAEMVEKQLDAMVQRRARKGETDPDETEQIWGESVRRYHARRRDENRRE